MASLPAWPTRGERKRPLPTLPQPPPASVAEEEEEKEARRQGEEEEDDDDVGMGMAPEVTDVVAALSLLAQRLYPTDPSSASSSLSATGAGSRGSYNSSKKKQKRQPPLPPPPQSPPQAPAPAVPVVLQHQLYTVLSDATAVDVELEALRRRHFVRLLKLLTQRQADVAVCLDSAYLARIQAAVEQCEALAAADEAAPPPPPPPQGDQQQEEEQDQEQKEQERRQKRQREAEERVYALRFLKAAAGRFTSLSVTRPELEAAMAAFAAASPPPPPAQPPHPCAGHGKKANTDRNNTNTSTNGPSSLVDRALKPLLKLGFLARRVDSRLEEAYWFSAPELGRVTASLPAGRRAILAALRRSRYKELSERNVQGGLVDLKGSALSPQFHVADLVGAKEVLAVETAAGRFLRLPPGAAAASASGPGRRRNGGR